VKRVPRLAVTSSQTGVELDEIGSGSKSLAIWEVGAPMTPMWHTYYGGSYMIAVSCPVVALACLHIALLIIWTIYRSARST